jgi:hypothetical protein
MAPRQSANTEVAVQEEPQVTRFKRVVIQRPSGNTDSHIFLGFNSYEGHFEFDKPIELPADMVDYYRSQKRAEFRPDDSGRPVVSHINAYNIIDA